MSQICKNKKINYLKVKNYVESFGSVLCTSCENKNDIQDGCNSNMACMSSLEENRIIKDLLSRVKKKNPQPIFVDLGASNGFTISNTYNLVLNNWNGLSVECADNKYFLLSMLYNNINSCREFKSNELLNVKLLIPYLNFPEPGEMNTKNEENYGYDTNMIIPLIFKNLNQVDINLINSCNINIDKLQKYKVVDWQTGSKNIFNIFNQDSNLSFVKEKVTPINILNLLRDNNIPLNFEFLSLDIDSYDYDVLYKLLTKYKPLLICAEIQVIIPPPIKFKLNFAENFWWGGGNFYGMSISMIYELCKKFNYSIVKMEYGNVFLMPSDISPHNLTPEKAWEEGYKNKPKNFQTGFTWNKEKDYDISILKSDDEKLKYFQDMFKDEDENCYELFI